MESLRILLPSHLFTPAESAHFEGAFDEPVMKAGFDLYSFSAPLAWQVDITNTGGAFLVSGTVEGEANATCARCLDEFSFPVTGEIEGYYLMKSEAAAPADMDEDEFDVLPDDNTIDLKPLIAAALLLEFPLIPLCDDACLGLCPVCGANLNEGSCGCKTPSSEEEAPADSASKNPFAVLKDFSFEEK